MKKLLVTGFEPFGNQTVNASWEVVKQLPSHVENFELKKLLVPVIFGKAAEAVIRAADEIQPDIILCIGQAAGRAVITPEYVAINLRHARIPDNADNLPQDEPILPDGPAAYFASLPVRDMVSAMLSIGIRSEISYSAGTFVCNDLLYSLLHYFNCTGTDVGFIHVPLLKEQSDNGQPCMEANDIIQALIAAIGVL